MAKLDEKSFGDMIRQTLVQAQLEGNFSQWTQWHIITWQIHTLKPVAFLEVHQAVSLLISIAVAGVNQILNSPLGTDADGVRQQPIRGALSR